MALENTWPCSWPTNGQPGSHTGSLFRLCEYVYLVTLVLWWLRVHDVWLRYVLHLARESCSQLRQRGLVVAHANSKRLEVVQFVGQTNSMTIDEHPVTRLLIHLVNLEATLLQHGLLQLGKKVL